MRDPRFSSRLEWDTPRNRLSELLRAKRAAGTPVLDLTESNPTKAGLAYPESRVLAALSDPGSLSYDPDPRGVASARIAVAAYHRERGVDVDPDRVVLTAGTSEAYARIFQLLCDPGDEVLVPRPSYPLFEILASLESVAVATYPLVLHDGGWEVDLDALRAAVTPRTRAIVVVDPNNPTGSFLKRGELDALLDVCRSNGIALVSDEVFADYAFEGGSSRAQSTASVDSVLTFTLSGLSKVVALPQLKLGWIVVNGPERARAQALERLELISDTYLSVATPVQLGTSRLLGLRQGIQEEIRERLRANLTELRGQLRAAPSFRLLPVEGGWYATIEVPRTRTEEEWTLHLLDRHDVLVQPGYFYDFDREAFLIVSLLTEPSKLAEGLRLLLGTFS
jgi:aspartate/methionine/tyrosine aminotransferase